METKTGNKIQMDFSAMVPPFLIYELWKQSYELWKQQIQTAS